MEIYEKIDFLMKITGSKNSALGKAVSFDPSYISKIRAGSRSVPKDPKFAKSVSAFFAKNIKDEYQLEAVSRLILTNGTLSADKKELTESIYQFLAVNSDGKGNDNQVYRLLTDITNIFTPVPTTPGISEFKAVEPVPQEEESIVPISVFYGNQGKRDAVKKFLSYLISQKKSFTLHLFSDEDMSWLYENPEFAKEWAMMIIRLLKTGSRIQIIHTVSRDLSELMEAIRKWLPIYATGAIEPYFCPKLRDGIFCRSMFIAKDHQALISTSVTNNTEGMANFLIRKDEVVKALDLEYQNYFAICKPLMKMYSPESGSAFMDVLTKPDLLSGKYMLSSPLPSLWTAPKKLIEKIAKSNPESTIANVVNSLKKNMLEVLENGGEITEILAVGDTEAFKYSPLPLSMGDFFGISSYKYDIEDFRAHLMEIEHLTKVYPKYKVIISRTLPASILLFSHSESDTIIVNSASPTIAFVISHQQFSYAFYEYLTRIEKEVTEKQSLSLEEYISML